MVSNAALQWVPTHRELVVRWAGQLPAGAWIAFQVPGNFDAPSHHAVRELARREPFLEPLRDMPWRDVGQVDTPAEYAGLLTDAGCVVDAWETTYIHQLSGETPVLDWITGTALTQVKGRLTDELAGTVPAGHHPDVGRGLPQGGMTASPSSPFRRVFVVAQVACQLTITYDVSSISRPRAR